MKSKPSQETGKPVTEQQHEEPASPPSPARSAQRADGGSGGVELDTPPSNTVSNNCNGEYFKALRWGVDSLYLSYPGELMPEVNERLTALKLMAQSLNPVEQSQAQYSLGDHLFEVKSMAPRGFAFLLEDNAFRIQLSRSTKLPAAYVKISSSYLAHVGPRKAADALQALIDALIVPREPANVSRIDCYLDFVWPGNMEWSREAWVTRGGGIDSYSEGGVFTGWVVGRGGVISARLYYKLLQAAKIGSDYLLTLWTQGGWKPPEHVWRLEFQLRREILTQHGLTKLDAVLGNLNGLWSYATTEWLKLTIPNPDDQTRSRWPIHPLWGYLSAVDWETDGGPLTRRFTNARVPGDDKLFSMALSVLVSYMAREGIEDSLEGYKALMTALYAHHSAIAKHLDLSFDEYLDQKLGIKGRQFNKLRNSPRGLPGLDEDILAQKAEAYRKARDGS
jgi:hypothetical protein